ncbi:MAG: DUF3086 domain-containing protein [Synechococcaceae cyanobacterium]
MSVDPPSPGAGDPVAPPPSPGLPLGDSSAANAAANPANAPIHGAADPAVTGAGPNPDPLEPAPRAAGAPPDLLELALAELRQRREALLAEISALERRRDQLERELGASFSGQSDAIARRVKGFQDYLVGALQDLAAAAERLELVVPVLQPQPSPLDRPPAPEPPAPAVAGLFSQDETLIRERLRRFQGQPDFNADPWRLRRSLDAASVALLEDWFLNQGGRGAQPSRGSRSRNAVVTAAAVAILGDLYGDRFQTLVLAGQPERLGEWRRCLQDALGLSREDFGPNSGIVLFERPEALVERADRLEERGELPFIVIDALERAVEIPVLQFPLWIAYSASPEEISFEDDLA